MVLTKNQRNTEVTKVATLGPGDKQKISPKKGVR